MTQKLAGALLAATVAFITASPAGATVHSGSTMFKPPTETPTIGPQPPLCNQSIELPSEASQGDCVSPPQGIERVSVAYDDQAGSISISVAVYDSQYWGAVLGAEGFALGRTCGEEDLEGNFQGAGSLYHPSGRVEGVINGVVLQGYEGVVQGADDWTGQEHIFMWQDSAFTHRNWRCLTLSGGGTIDLDGWPQPTPVRAHRAALSELHALDATFARYRRSGRYRQALGGLDTLTKVRVTNNGWADAFLVASHPRQYEQAGNQMLFRLSGGRWAVYSWGTSPDTRGVPANVRHALGA